MSHQDYVDYINADYGHNFATWLGIEVPVIEYNGDKVRFRRFETYSKKGVCGEWEKTKKEAKESYKAALKRTNNKSSYAFPGPSMGNVYGVGRG